MDLLPCPFCGQTPWVEYGTDVSYGIRVEHLCRTTPCETEADAAAEWNAANAPADPALLALDRELRIRNLIAEREFNTAAANRELTQFGEWRWDHDAADKACADASAALLAPDGAASEGVGE